MVAARFPSGGVQDNVTGVLVKHAGNYLHDQLVTLRRLCVLKGAQSRDVFDVGPEERRPLLVSATKV